MGFFESDEKLDGYQQVINSAWDTIHRKRVRKIPIKDISAITRLQEIAGRMVYLYRSAKRDNEFLKAAAQVALSPRLTGDAELDDYIKALFQDGPLAYTWSDKPHRLVVELVTIAKQQREELEALRRKYES